MNLSTHNHEETLAFGERFGRLLQGGDIVLLFGELGAGKTTLTQGICRGLGIKEKYIRSPTFTLINEYQGNYPVYHIDLYRIEGDLEAWDIGIDEYLSGNGISVIEWADRAPKIYPEDRLIVRLESGSDTVRHFRIIGEGERSIEIVDALKEMRLA